jgi:hypothetical protein
MYNTVASARRTNAERSTVNALQSAEYATQTFAIALTVTTTNDGTFLVTI